MAGASAPRKSGWLRDAWVCISLANLLALRLWGRVLDPATSYFLHETRPASAYLATLLLVLVIAAAGFGVARAVRALGGPWLRATEPVFALAAALGAWALRPELADLFHREHMAVLDAVFGAAGGVLVAAALLPWERRAAVRRVSVTFLLVLSPFAAAITFQALEQAREAASGEALRALPSAPRAPADGGPRVVVLLFDELDQLRAFEERPQGLALPHFDALRGEVYSATRVGYAAIKTEQAVPSLFTGRRVVTTRDAGPSDRWLVFEDGSRELFSETATFLRDATAAGENVALAGWYHPYCRVIGDDLVDCVARSNRQELQDRTFGDAFLRQLGAFIELSPHGRKLVRALDLRHRSITRSTPEWHRESFEQIHAKSLALASDPALDLVFLHYPVPHPPGIWDAQTGTFAAKGASYTENHALADHALGELLTAMREAGVWDRTALVVTADHPARTKGYLPLPSPRLAPGESRPIPFFVRIPGVPGMLDERSRFSATRLHALVPALLEGRVASNEALVALLTRRPASPSRSEAEPSDEVGARREAEGPT